MRNKNNLLRARRVGSYENFQICSFESAMRITQVMVKESSTCDRYAKEFLLERTFVLGHRLCEVGWPFPSSPLLPPQCFHQAPIRCRGEQEASVQPLARTVSKPRVFGTEGKCYRHENYQVKNFHSQFSKEGSFNRFLCSRLL